MSEPLDSAALDQLFDKARTNHKWQAREVPGALLRQIVEHMKWGPTSVNCSPARVVFVKSAAAKERLKPHLSSGNVEQTMSAPVTAIIGYDLNFFEYLPRLYPAADAKSWFVGKKEHSETTAFRNGTLQGGYFILAARALGLDCGPMSGFNNAAVDAEFFPGTEIRSNFLCNLGFGAPTGVYPRAPRFSFDEMATIV